MDREERGYPGWREVLYDLVGQAGEERSKSTPFAVPVPVPELELRAGRDRRAVQVPPTRIHVADARPLALPRRWREI